LAAVRRRPVLVGAVRRQLAAVRRRPVLVGTVRRLQSAAVCYVLTQRLTASQLHSPSPQHREVSK